MKNYKEAVALLPQDLRAALLSVGEETMAKISEIRLYAQRPVAFGIDGELKYLCAGGRLSSFPKGGFTVSAGKLDECVAALCRYSVHAYAESLCRGYVTLPGGHRAGVCGMASVKDGEIAAVRRFTSVNIRVARDFLGCCGELVARLSGCDSFLIIGAPMTGKTTLLRDVCRYFSGLPKKVAVVDERDELAGNGSPNGGRDLGANTDVLSLYPKGAGIEIALRCLSPDIIVLDEIGGLTETKRILEGVNSGVSFIATAHAYSVEEALSRPQIRLLIESGAFKKAVVLASRAEPGKIKDIYDCGALIKEKMP